MIVLRHIVSVGSIGAFSEIYIAEDVNNPSERVAVKYQNPDFDASVMRWEGVVMSDLAEVPTVPRMIYHGRDGRRDYLIMELLTGEDMASLRDRCRVGGVRDLLPIEVCSYLTRQMLNSLQAMHEKGYVHRDVKPSNFVRRSKTSTEFCVIDFGLAKQVRSSLFFSKISMFTFALYTTAIFFQWHFSF